MKSTVCLKVLIATVACLAVSVLVSAQVGSSMLDRLPLLPRGERRAAQFSSHSPHQQNGDVYHHLYDDEHGDAVIFDVAGSGCVTNIWGTVLDPEGVLKFYFDGESEPSYVIGLIDFFRGGHSDFKAPLLTYDRRGYYLEDSFAGCCFKPIPFEHSLKIAVQGKSTFYHILYETYPAGCMPDKISFEERERQIKECFEVPALQPSNICDAKVIETLLPWQSQNLFEFKGGEGAIRLIEIEADAEATLLSNLQLRMIWDEIGAESGPDNDSRVYERSKNSRFYHVNAPLGLFFGTPDKPLNLNTLPIASTLLAGNRVRFTCRFVMPFRRSARIELFNRSDNSYFNIRVKTETGPISHPIDDMGYFETCYREGKSIYGRDWTIAQLNGTGNFVGVVQSCRYGHYCEGNEHFYIDGNRTPQINGTGTEDYYLGCFWPNMPYHTPFAGCVNDVRKESGGDPNRFLACLPTDYSVAAVYYRFHIEMPLPFLNSFDALIQQGAENTVESDYATLCYYYLAGETTMKQTDFIDVANPSSMKLHGYRCRGDQRVNRLTARYEGDKYMTTITDDGYFHKPLSQISFRVAATVDNNGVLLRRRTDQSVGRQSAEVFVDDVRAGEWYDPQSNNILRWYDSEFVIPPSLTQGKKELKITLRPSGNGFSDYEYSIYSITK